MLSPNIVGLIVFLGMASSYGLYTVSQASKRNAKSIEFARRMGPGTSGPSVVRKDEVGLIDGLLGPAGQWLQGLILRSSRSWSLTNVVVGSAFLTVFGMIAGGFVGGVVWTLIGASLGAAPVIFLSRRASEVDQMVTAQMPDAIDLMGRALRCGHAFPDAMRIAAAESPEPLSIVLGAAAEEHGLGVELRDCFASMLRRVPTNFEVRLLMSCVLLNRETGGNLVEILDELAATIRERAVFSERVVAMTTEVRTSAFVLGAMPFVAGGALMLVSPSYLQPLFDGGFGQNLLFAAVALMVCGVAIMGRIATVEAE